MEDRFSQQLKKGVLELLVMELLCDKPSYGYELLVQLREKSDGRFLLKEGTLYPILYRLEDEGLIEAKWSQGEGRNMPKKIYQATQRGIEEHRRRRELWLGFRSCVDGFLAGGKEND